MQYIKLQAGCLLILIYVIVGFWRETSGKNSVSVKCDPIFDVMLGFAPWSVLFDGITAWTVNHLDTVPRWANNGLHLLFFLLMNGVTVVAFLYFYDLTLGLSKKKLKVFCMLIPAIVSSLVVIAFIGELRYVEGKTTNYSMGISAIVCYLSIAFHYGYMLYLLFFNHRTIEKRKKLNVLSFIALSGVCLVVQVLHPESLISALYPTVMVIGIYNHFENPAILLLQQNNKELVSAFATIVETRDGSTGGHIKRTRAYVEIILHEMARKKEYRRLITKDYRDNVKNAAPLHDVGKIATPDEILMKPGRLTDAEFAIMKEHAAKGGELIEKSLARMKNPDFRQIAYEVACFHHEKWDGTGYPKGLSGEDIPLHARIMAIADVFDAVSEDRCYRPALPLTECFHIIEEGAGKAFDPELVEIFLSARKHVEKQHYSITAESR